MDTKNNNRLELIIPVGIIKYSFRNKLENALLAYTILANYKKGIYYDKLKEIYDSLIGRDTDNRTIKRLIKQLSELEWIKIESDLIVVRSHGEIRCKLNYESNCIIVENRTINSLWNFKSFMIASVITESNVKQKTIDVINDYNSYLHISIERLSNELKISTGKVSELIDEAESSNFLIKHKVYKNGKTKFNNKLVSDKKWEKDDNGYRDINGVRLTNYLKSNLKSKILSNSEQGSLPNVNLIRVQLSDFQFADTNTKK